eukprot:4548751-Ditylum_brightwellii.AAC.1
MSMCLIGRAIAGIGSPRIINRRCVADITPFSLRTASSAAFGLATALGSAMGPGLAIILDFDYFETQFNLPFLGTQYFNGMTGPGYVMACAWGVYGLIILLFFNEPTRSGITELKRRETAALATETPNHAELPATNASESTTPLEDIDEGQIFKKLQHFNDNACARSKFHIFKHATRAMVTCMTIIYVKRIANPRDNILWVAIKFLPGPALNTHIYEHNFVWYDEFDRCD